MKKLKTVFALCGLGCFLSSCYVSKPVTSVNGPSFYNSDITYQPKPLSADSVHHANYVSASIVNGQGANENDVLTAGEINLGRAYTTKHFNFSGGVFGAAGSFSNATIPSGQPYYFNNKFTGMAGARASINYYITSGHVDIRVIGIEAAYSNEFGDYADYRKLVAGVPTFYTSTRTDLLTIGGSTEVTWYGRDPSWQYGFRLFVGKTNIDYPKNPNDNYALPSVTGALAYFMQIKRYFMIGEFTGAGGHFGLGYRF
jgi:hypothetical protein